jgi:hypothetical protein
MSNNPDNWFHLPFITGSSGTCSIEEYQGGYALISKKTNWIDNVWFCTSWPSIADLLSQYEYATGRVLCTGLGLGILPLLVQSKAEVSEVVVLENDPAVLELFYMQKFSIPKLKIIECDAESYTDSESFSTILPDHYNELPKDELTSLMRSVNVIRHNTYSPDAIVLPFRWTEFSLYTCSHRTGWGTKIGMPYMSKEQEHRYIRATKQALDQATNICAILRQINLNRA